MQYRVPARPAYRTKVVHLDVCPAPECPVAELAAAEPGLCPRCARRGDTVELRPQAVHVVTPVATPVA